MRTSTESVGCSTIFQICSIYMIKLSLEQSVAHRMIPGPNGGQGLVVKVECGYG